MGIETSAFHKNGRDIYEDIVRKMEWYVELRVKELKITVTYFPPSILGFLF